MCFEFQPKHKKGQSDRTDNSASKPKSTAAANPTCKMSVPANDWNSRLKDFISGLAGLVPEIGEIVKFLLQTYWPTSYDDIWKLMENAMTDLVHKIVDATILKQELAK